MLFFLTWHPTPRCKDIVSIPDMALALWGAPGLAFTNTVILICQIGNCIAYFIFLAISLTAVIEDFFPSLAAEHAYSPYVILILCWYLAKPVSNSQNPDHGIEQKSTRAKFDLTCAGLSSFPCWFSSRMLPHSRPSSCSLRFVRTRVACYRAAHLC